MYVAFTYHFQCPFVNTVLMHLFQWDIHSYRAEYSLDFSELLDENINNEPLLLQWKDI